MNTHMLNHIIGLPVPVKMYKMYQCYWFIDLCRNSNKLGQTMLGFYRATLCVNVVFAVARCLSVCPSVCLLRWWIVSRRLKISNFFLGPVAPSF